MEIEVDIFSGRPNPRWTVTCEEAEEFLSLFQALPAASSAADIDDGLGYSGLIITEPGNRSRYDEIRVAQGRVVARDDDQLRQFLDPGRKLEQWLLQTGQGQIDPELYRLITGAARFD